MADLSKFKGRRTLGAPPPLSEASANLDAPEIAAPAGPAAPRTVTPDAALSSFQDGQRDRPWGEQGHDQGNGQRDEHGQREGQGRRVRDGRSARRTGRIIQFATRVTAEFDERFRGIAERDGLLHVELLERSLLAYERGRQPKKK